MQEKRKSKQKTLLSIISIFILLLFTGAVCLLVGKPMLQFVSEPEKFRTWIDERGFFGRIIFIGMIVFQILIAIIPGEALEIGAGYAFGAVEGTILCTIGNLLGGILVFALVRTVGVRLVELFFSREKILSLKFLQNNRRVNIIVFIIFLLPGTPKDLVAYFVGLINMDWRVWAVICSLARLPSVITSTAGGSALGTKEYINAIIIFAATLAVSGVGWLIYHTYCKYHNNKKED